MICIWITHRMNYCVSIVTMVRQTCHSVTLYVHRPSCSLLPQCHHGKDISSFPRSVCLSTDFRESPQYQIPHRSVRWEPLWYMRSYRRTGKHGEGNMRFSRPTRTRLRMNENNKETHPTESGFEIHKTVLVLRLFHVFCRVDKTNILVRPGQYLCYSHLATMCRLLSVGERASLIWYK